MEGSGQLHGPAAPRSHWIGGWVGPRAVMDAVVKRKIPSPRRELNPRIQATRWIGLHKKCCTVTCLERLDKTAIYLKDNGCMFLSRLEFFNCLLKWAVPILHFPEGSYVVKVVWYFKIIRFEFLVSSCRRRKECGSLSEINFNHLHLIPRIRIRGAIRGCIQKLPDRPPGARTANGTALCH
jgi:hypothetical protein